MGFEEVIELIKSLKTNRITFDEVEKLIRNKESKP